MKTKNKGRVLIVDGSNYLFRGAFSVQPLTSKSGNPTNGIKGFMNILLADLDVLKPTHVVAVFDKGGRSWRKDMYPEYKANRTKKQLDPRILEIYQQAKPLRRLLRYAGFRVSAKKGVEGDDIIGTLALDFSEEGHKVIIGSKDKDFGQIVGRNISMLLPDDRTLLDAEGIKAKFGVRPDQIVDYLALLGDGVDNIPGVYKCGPVTAAKLLQQYGDLKTIRKNKDSMTKALRANFEAVEDKFVLTKKLLRLKTDIELNTNIDNCLRPTSLADIQKFESLCEELSLAQTRKQILKALK